MGADGQKLHHRRLNLAEPVGRVDVALRHRDAGAKAAIDGFDVAGKTSTAEIYDEENGGYRKNVYNLAFTGFLADSSSKLVCFVGANEVPGDGVVTPIFKDIMTSAIDRFGITSE